MPVNVIMPPASAPKIACADEPASGRASWSPRCSSRIGRPMPSATATTFAASTGTHIAELSQMRRRNRRPAARTS